MFEFDIVTDHKKETPSNKLTSKINMEKDVQYENMMFALPFDECSNLILYESKAEIDPLAQVIPYLNIKSRQIPKISAQEQDQEKEILSARESTKNKDSLSMKISSYTSFQKKKSSQLQRTKLSNYINNKDSRSNEPENVRNKQKIDNRTIIKQDQNIRDSSDDKAFESTSIMCKVESSKSLKDSKNRQKEIPKIVNISMSKQNMDRLKILSKNTKAKNFGSLIGNINKIKLDEPQLSSRCKKVKRVSSNTSQDLDYSKTVKVMK